MNAHVIPKAGTSTADRWNSHVSRGMEDALPDTDSNRAIGHVRFVERFCSQKGVISTTGRARTHSRSSIVLGAFLSAATLRRPALMTLKQQYHG
jgi:hypothetical protein